MTSENNSGNENSGKSPKETSKKGFLSYMFGSLAKGVTAPLWWPATLAYKSAISTAKSDEPLKTKATKIATVGALAAAWCGAVGGAAMYGTSLAIVKANDTNLPVLNWPATEGNWKGKITRLSEKGTWPCNSFEGNIRTGEAADSQLFAVRKWQTDMVQAIKDIPQNADVTLVYRDNGIDQNSFGNVIRDNDGEFNKVEPTSFFGCIQHSDHTAVGIHYTNPETNEKVSVGLKP